MTMMSVYPLNKLIYLMMSECCAVSVVLLSQVVNGDALVLKLNSNTQKKVFLASVRLPRDK